MDRPDTSGQERFRSITRTYYRSAQAVVLVYDISHEPSFASLDQWCLDIEEYAVVEGTSQPNKGLVKVLVGNKSDMEMER